MHAALIQPFNLGIACTSSWCLGPTAAEGPTLFASSGEIKLGLTHTSISTGEASAPGSVPLQQDYVPALGDGPVAKDPSPGKGAAQEFVLSLPGPAPEEEAVDCTALLEDVDIMWKKLLVKRQGASANMGALFNARRLKDEVEEASKSTIDTQQKKAMAAGKVANKVHAVDDACLALEKKAVKNMGVANVWRRNDLAVRSGGNGLCEIMVPHVKGEIEVRMCVTGANLSVERGSLIPMTRMQMEELRKLLAEVESAKSDQIRLESAVSQCSRDLKQKIFLAMATCAVGTGASSACADHLGSPLIYEAPADAAFAGTGMAWPGPYINNYDGQNPLGIQPNGQRSQNYFLMIGDWGRAGSPGPCQRAVADHLKAYVSRQQQQGKKLLFIASVGDNFYWSGVTPGAWQASWASLYGPNDPGSPLYQVPWLSVLGNHDLGNDDPYAACADQMQAPLATVNGQRYGCEQFNADKNPNRPGNTKLYWLPDYNYHYEIPEADLEVIAIDTNQVDIEGLGGDAGGAWKMGNVCGGEGNM
ncbi:PAP3, partial [Symbiodinium microadriaticum]